MRGNTTNGLCECGCGQRTTPAPQTHRRRGNVKGEPQRFVRGHNIADEGRRGAGRLVGADTRAKLSELAKRKTPEQHSQWKGGRTVIGGRIHVYVGRDHPMAIASGYVREYRLVMASSLGRYLKSSEHVHHIDLDRNNNALDNLVLVSRVQHTKIHNLIRGGVAPASAVTLVMESPQ